MNSRRLSSSSSFPDHSGSAGWTGLHQALRDGIPHATQILAILDAHGFSFPWSPTFCCQAAELPCYRLIHQSWREGRLAELLYLLAAWREPEGKLPAACCRRVFQQALFDFLRDHRRDGLQSLRACLSRQSLLQDGPELETDSVDAIRRRLDGIWETHRGNHAA